MRAMTNPLAIIAAADTVAEMRRAVRGSGPDGPLPNRRRPRRARDDRRL
jgi:hypothetical protein